MFERATKLNNDHSSTFKQKSKFFLVKAVTLLPKFAQMYENRFSNFFAAILESNYRVLSDFPKLDNVF